MKQTAAQRHFAVFRMKILKEIVALKETVNPESKKDHTSVAAYPVLVKLRFQNRHYSI